MQVSGVLIMTLLEMLFFGVGNSSSSHFDNRKNNLLILGKRPNFGINGSYGASEKKLDINFSKPNTKFVRVYIIMVIIVICLLMERKSLRLKLTIKMLTFKLNFILEVFLMDLVFWVQRSIFEWKCLRFFQSIAIQWVNLTF